MNVTLRQLQAFLAVAETNSFSRAATQLNAAQSRVSILIRDLEAALGVRLFDRTTRRMEVTAAGREFHSQAGKVMADLRHAIEDTHALGQRKRGRLTVAAPPLLMEAIIPRLLVPFKRDFPGVRVIMMDARNERIIQAVKAGEADVGIGTFTRDEDGLVRTSITHDTLMLFSPRGHALAALDRPRWRDLQGTPLITLTPHSGIRHLVEYGSKVARIEIMPAYEVGLVTTALALVEVGLGVTVLPSNAMPAARGRSIVARPLTHPKVSRDINMISRHGRSLSPAAAEWVQRLQRELRAAFGKGHGQ
jgi:DNA-binding transcriptional LysR family regulator